MKISPKLTRGWKGLTSASSSYGVDLPAYGVPNESKSHSCVTPQICSVLLIYRTCYLYIRRATYISDVLLIYRTCYLYIRRATYISDVLLIYRTCYLYIKRATYISDMLLKILYQTCYLYIGHATYIYIHALFI